MCVLCEASFIWSESALGTPASAGRPYACASAIGGEGAEGRKAEGRKPKAAGSTGPLIKVRCRKCITAAPCRAAANTAPPLTIGAPNRIPLAYADRYGYYTLLLHSGFGESKLDVPAATGLTTDAF